MARSVRPWRGQPAAVAVGIHNLRADGRQLILEIQRHGRELAAKLGLRGLGSRLAQHYPTYQ